MKPVDTLVHLAISHVHYPMALAEIKAVIGKLMDGVKPTDSDIQAISLAYQCDLVLCTLDFQDLQKWIEERFL